MCVIMSYLRTYATRAPPKVAFGPAKVLLLYARHMWVRPIGSSYLSLQAFSSVSGPVRNIYGDSSVFVYTYKCYTSVCTSVSQACTTYMGSSYRFKLSLQAFSSVSGPVRDIGRLFLYTYKCYTSHYTSVCTSVSQACTSVYNGVYKCVQACTQACATQEEVYILRSIIFYTSSVSHELMCT